MTKLVVIVGFIVAFSAGLMVGMGLHQHAATEETSPTTRPNGSGGSGGRGSWIAQELDLTPQQQEALKKIWADSPDRSRREEHDDARRQLRRERDEAILALVPDRSKYDEIMRQYEEKTDALDDAMRKGFEEKVRLTKAHLTPEQNAKYDEMLKRRSRDWGRDKETTRRSSSGATTRPSQP
jgi:Spy/CpxP family protein refolding chaperone